jgi:hypothetical protein
MEFANPLFLFGLAAIAIPIIIHLFNFRRFRKVFFTNVKFIEELKQQTRQQSQLRHLLVLLMRILAISALVIAFAQPFIPVGEKQSGQAAVNAVSIYVDNSFSMEAETTDGPLLNQALNLARETAMAYGSSDQYQLLTNDFEGRHQRFVSREDFLELLNEVELSPVTRSISEAYKRQAELLNNNVEGSKTAGLISDFQQSTTDLQNITPDSTINTYLIPAATEKSGNIYIDSVWFQEPVYRVDQLATLHVRIVNDSEQDYEKTPVRLKINDAQRAISSFDIEAGETLEITMPYSNNSAGLQFGELSISDHPVTYDDTFYFVYEVLNEIPVLAINTGDENPFLNSLFTNDSLIVFSNANENQLDYTNFGNYNLIILNGLNVISSGLSQELKRFSQAGGHVAVFPGEMADVSSYREFFLNMETAYTMVKDTFQTRISNLNLESALYDDVFESIPENIDLPVVFQHYTLGRQTKSLMEVLLETQDGDVFLGSEPVGKGMMYVFSTALNDEWSNFPRHAIFVPTLYKMALLSKPSSKLYYITGSEESILAKNEALEGDRVIKIKSRFKDFEIIPETRTIGSQMNIFASPLIREAGFYDILNDGNLVTSVAYNYNRAESRLESFDAKALETQISDNLLESFSVIKPAQNRSLTTVIEEINSGKRLWKLFLLLALGFLLGEVILLRLWK